MKKLIPLILLMMMSLQGLSQSVIDTTKIQLKKPIVRLVIKDLIIGDGAKTEIKLLSNKLNLLENRWWINSLSNVFSYLDVILFDDFEHRKDDDALEENYTSYAKASLTAISVSAHADGVLEGKEKNLFNIFLASSNLKDEVRDEMKAQFKSRNYTTNWDQLIIAN